jgi:hypothetical protein
MDIGAAGHLLIFFAVTIGQILLSLLVFSYAAYSFLHVFIDTAAGNDEVRWPGDPMLDWILKVWYLLWLLAIWAVPAFLVLALLGISGQSFVVFLVGFLWLIFPITLLSSLSASSRLVIFRPVIVRLLLKHPATLAGFYAITGILLVICVGLFCASVLPEGSFLPPVMEGDPRHRPRRLPIERGTLLPVAAVAGAIGLLIYARLLGRIGWLISRHPSGDVPEEGRPEEADQVETFDPWSTPDEERKAERESEPPRNRRTPPLRSKKSKTKGRSHVQDPWAVPEEEPPAPVAPLPAKTKSLPEDPYGPAEGSYDLAPADAPRPPVEPVATVNPFDESPEPYAVAPAPETAPPPVPAPAPEVTKLEEELAAPRLPPPAPVRPLVSGVYSFPFYQACLGPLATLALGFLGVAFLLRLQIALFPPFWR